MYKVQILLVIAVRLYATPGEAVGISNVLEAVYIFRMIERKPIQTRALSIPIILIMS